MQIAIISDIHNNQTNLKKVLDYCAEKEIKTIICCGDLASLETLDFLNDNFKGDIYFTFGNMDDDFLKDTFCHPERIPPQREESKDLIGLDSSTSVGMTCKYKNTKIFKNFGETQFEVGPRTGRGSTSVSIAFVHYPDFAKELARTGKYDFVFYGHTHKPWVASVPLSGTTADQRKKEYTMLNPGNVAGEIYPPTFAVWNTENDKFELVRIQELK
jgi:putative phosphoesterase